MSHLQEINNVLRVTFLIIWKNWTFINSTDKIVLKMDLFIKTISVIIWEFFSLMGFFKKNIQDIFRTNKFLEIANYQR